MIKKFTNPLTKAHTKELTLSFPDSNDPVCGTLKGGQLWGAEMGSLLSIFIDEQSNILDIGGHIGTLGALCCSLTKGKVISIEADPGNFAYLKENKELNGFDNWEVLNYAAGATNGTIDICVNGPSSHVYNGEVPEETISVPVVRLDDLIRYDIQVVKMDIEGSEISAIQGMERILESGPVVIFEVNGFCLKWFQQTPNDLIKAFEEFGYRIFVIRDTLIPINHYEAFPFGCVDCLALKDEHLDKVKFYISLSLTLPQRRSMFADSEFYGNSDIKSYFSWYKKQISL